MKFSIRQKPAARFRYLYSCDGCHSIILDSDIDIDGAEYFAKVIARRELGPRAVVDFLQPELFDSSSCSYWVADIGFDKGNYFHFEKTIRFVLKKEPLVGSYYDKIH